MVDHVPIIPEIGFFDRVGAITHFQGGARGALPVFFLLLG